MGLPVLPKTRGSQRLFSNGLVAILLALAFFPYFVEAAAWPGWRGGEHQGRGEWNGSILTWDSEKNVIWKATLPGDGFSSPAVSEQMVYLTAVTPKETRRLAILGGKIAGYLLFLAFIFMGLHFLVRSETVISPQSCRVVLMVQSSLAALFGVAVCSVLFGERILNIDTYSGPARLLLASLTSAPCLACSLAFWHRGRSRASLGAVGGCLLICAGGLAVLLVVASGWPESLWKLPAALLLITGLTMAAVFYLNKAFAGRELITPELFSARTALPGARWFRGGLLALKLFTVALAIVSGVVTVRMCVRDSVGDHLTFQAYEPRISIWPMVAVALPGMAGLAIWKSRAVRNRTELIILLSAMTTAPVVLGVLIEFGLVHVTYLRHVLLSRQPVLQPLFGWWSVGIAFFFLTAGTLSAYAWRSRVQPPIRGHAFRVVAALLAVWVVVSRSGLAQPILGSPEVLSIVAWDRATGQRSWIRAVAAAPTEFDRINSRATSTPAIWGDRIYAYFGSNGLVCVDRDGKKQWRRTDLPFSSHYGVVVSPVIVDGRVIVLSESSMNSSNHFLSSFIAAVDGRTGQLLWKKPRPRAMNYGGNNRTPIIVSDQERKLVVVWGGDQVAAYNPDDGEVQWTFQVPRARGRWDLVASPVADEERLYLPQHGELIALRTRSLGSGEEPVLWRRAIPFLNCSSPVIARGLLYVLSDRGTGYCLDAKTGEVLWSRSFKGVHYCSPVVLGDSVYFCSQEGVTTVVSGDPSGRIEAENNLGERTVASFAFADGTLFIRTEGHLYCIGSEGSGEFPQSMIE